MASKDPRVAQAKPLGAGQGLTELGRALAGLNPPTRPDVGAADNPGRAGNDARPEVELTMADLVSDDNGEIVFFNDSGFRTLGITTDASVVADGQAGRHVTASGADVSGYKFVTFDNGLTLYFERGLDLIVRQQPASR